MVRSSGFGIPCSVGLLALLTGCGDGGGEGRPDAAEPDAAIDAMPDAPPDANPQTPGRLIDTGLCVDAACTQITAGIRTYVPRWQLWSDGATKQRWIQLPPGAKINNADADHWEFPVGTKLWKSFSLGGVRVETRYMVRLDAAEPPEDDWFMVSYVWNAAQTDAVAVPAGRENANGTAHDVPSRNDCRQCHERIGGRVLGFSALALDYAGPVGELDLDDVSALGWLTTALPGAASPRYPLPVGRNAGEIANAADAVGYLHMNCGHCHNPQSPVYNGTLLQLRLTTGALASWPETVVYTTAIGVTAEVPLGASTLIVKPQDPDDSVMIKRMVSDNLSLHMPALGSVVVDQEAQVYMRAWINSLPVQ
jgi:hypothetical protein